MAKLLIQPQDGVKAILAAIKKAKRTIEIVIFRFDRAEIETALHAAVERGVQVSALIAYANRGGEKHLRKLEMRLLEAGVNVSRTPDVLVRYHKTASSSARSTRASSSRPLSARRRRSC
jgi:phosphatidylserine/phosphatidylglycerophosphate/cardiolipin synthase-like enzyme